MPEPPAQLLRRPSIIDEHLASLLETVCIEVEAGTELVADGIVHRLAELLSTQRASQSAAIIAEMAKSEENRIVFIQQEVIPPLVALVHKSTPDVLRQACRALGNMCFESQSGRQIVLSEGGIAALVSRLQELKPSKATTVEENSIHYMLCGSLHTTSMDNEEVQKEAIKLNSVPILIDYVKYSTDGTVIRFCLNIISTFLDQGPEVTEVVQQLNLAPILSDTLKNYKDNDTVREAVLDVLSNYNFLNQPMTQMQLYQAGVLSHIVEIINEDHEDRENDDAIERIASEVLVIVVSHDGIAQLAFEDTSLDLTREAVAWMNAYQEQMKGTGALVIGNLATSDLRSRELASHPRVIESLFNILNQDYSSDEMMVKVKHAALSALRNLSICEAAKPLIVPYLSVIINYVTSDMPMLVYKAVGCVRCLTRGNKDIATQLTRNSTLVANLVELVDKYKYHNGIQGEVPRLLSTLVVEGQMDVSIIQALVACDIIPHLLHMTTIKEYPQVQVEGWLAIQKILQMQGNTQLISSNIVKFCEDCLPDDTNPNVRILALSILRLYSPHLSKEDELEKVSEHLNRLVLSESDVPAQLLASQIKQSPPFN